MKKILIASLALSLGGCATVGKYPVHIPHHAPKPVVKAAPAPVAPATPNAVVKHRWTDRFKHHPRFFHHHDAS